jgi:nickel/cobalt transporter (NicO) family protein
MSVPRPFVWLAVLGVWLATPAPAGAHRLDEYLQATRLSIDVERVRLEIDLTAGVAVAPEVFASIDTNRDGQISDAEGDAYARQMLRSVVLSVDGRPAPVTLIEIRFPPFREMGLGVGTIQVRATANLSATGAGRHQISYLNTHRSEGSVYLVNALVPADPRIQIAGQQRDPAQHRLTLDYTVRADASWARTGSLLAALAMAGVLGITRRPRTNAVGYARLP